MSPVSTRLARRAARIAVLPALLGGMVALAPAARAQMDSRDAIALQNQILELRQQVQQVQQLQQNQGSGGGALPPPTPQGGGGGGGGDVSAGGLGPQLLDRVSRLEDQVRELRGRVDDLTNQVQTQNAALTKQVSDLSFQLQQNGGGAVPGAAPAPAAGPAVAAPPVAASRPAAPTARTPEQALREGNAALARHDYTTAESAARAAGGSVSAQFLLGQSLTGERQYQQAALAYYDAYQRSPRGPRAPDALLGVGYAMTALGDHGSACEALGKLRTEFPNASAKVKGAASALRARSACH